MGERYTEVTIGGRTYQMSGSEDAEYMKAVAEYLNGKLAELGENPGFRKLSESDRNLMLMMNLADDYFRQRKRADFLEKKMEGMEDDIDNLRHELVRTRIAGEKDHD